MAGERLGAISIPDAVTLAEATVRLWDYAGNACQGRYFRLTPQEFNTWKTDNHIARILGQDIDQNPIGLARFAYVWVEKVPQQDRYRRRIHAAIEDAGGQRQFPNNVRAHWYQHFFNVALPADPPDRE